jgi:vancomycin resistance protein YoaR
VEALTENQHPFLQSPKLGGFQISTDAPVRRRRFPAPWLWALGLVVLVLASYGISRATGAGKVLGSVQAEQIELGGLTPGEAEAALVDLEANLAETPAAFTVGGTEVQITPASLGFDLDQAVMTRRALEIGREGNFARQFWWWTSHLFGTHHLTVRAAIDGDAVEAVMSLWDTEVIGNPPFPGGVGINGSVAEARYPRAGQQVDRSEAPGLILLQSMTFDRTVTALPVVTAQPVLTNEDVDQAVRRAQLILAGPVTLRNAERAREVTFTVGQIASALQSEVVHDRIEFSIDPDVVNEILEPLKAGLEDPPVDAQLVIEGDLATVVPGRRGTVINPETTAEHLLLAANSAARVGTFPIDESADPDVTTEELEALGIRHKVSQFTTYHPCCQNRVTNIHLMADKLNNTMVMPGETFSLNEAAGERTTEDGFLEDGTIIGGEITDTVGGGVSQFATTFYNAVFWGGFEDVAHKPHSFYFSRYPLGIEATISWPLPDLQFRNDTDGAILIRTSYSNSSITVAIYGDNEGRILAGEQSEGRLRMGVVAEGGPRAQIVTADVSEPYNHRDPPPPRYVGDETIMPPEQKEQQAPGQGYTVKVTRTITVDGVATVKEWTVVYSPRQQIIKLHPCQIEFSGVSCPSTTTTATSGPPVETTTTLAA